MFEPHWVRAYMLTPLGSGLCVADHVVPSSSLGFLPCKACGSAPEAISGPILYCLQCQESRELCLLVPAAALALLSEVVSSQQFSFQTWAQALCSIETAKPEGGQAVPRAGSKSPTTGAAAEATQGDCMWPGDID